MLGKPEVKTVILNSAIIIYKIYVKNGYLTTQSI